jgi:hypothetical protein
MVLSYSIRGKRIKNPWIQKEGTTNCMLELMGLPPKSTVTSERTESKALKLGGKIQQIACGNP